MQPVTKSGIAIHEYAKIESLICRYPNMDAVFYAEQLQLIINKELTANHFLVIGYLIGLSEGTEQTLSQFYNNQNPLSKCRVN